jgi:hypothetical protein
VAKTGRLVKTGLLTGVHRSVKAGRVSGYQLGFSQVINPLYLAKKKSCSWLRGLRYGTRYLLGNLLYSIAPGPHIDRRGRLLGNLTALSYLLRCRIDPELVVTLKRLPARPGTR